jgi:hypothetical protein
MANFNTTLREDQMHLYCSCQKRIAVYKNYDTYHIKMYKMHLKHFFDEVQLQRDAKK